MASDKTSSRDDLVPQTSSREEVVRDSEPLPRDPEASAALDQAFQYLDQHYRKDALQAARELLRASKEPGRREIPDGDALAEIGALIADGKRRTAVGTVARRNSGGNPRVAEQKARRYRRKLLEMKRSK